MKRMFKVIPVVLIVISALFFTMNFVGFFITMKYEVEGRVSNSAFEHLSTHASAFLIAYIVSVVSFLLLVLKYMKGDSRKS